MKYITITDKSSQKTSKILAKARSLFSVYVYDETNLDTQFPAPEKDITVSSFDSIESDEEHKEKSYNDFIAEKDKTYMTMRQYLLMSIKVFEDTGKHLDVEGWTLTSSLWLDGGLVGGYWRVSGAELCLNSGFRGYRYADFGPREQFNLTSSSSFPSENKEVDDITQAIQTVKNAGYKVYKEY